MLILNNGKLICPAAMADLVQRCMLYLKDEEGGENAKQN